MRNSASLTNCSGKGITTKGTPIPVGYIYVDGQASDWVGIDDFLTVTTDPMFETTYKVRSVKLAHDDTDLYLLFTLGVGVEEKFNAEYQQSGAVSTGSIGELFVEDEGTGNNISFRLPTGYQHYTDPYGTPMIRPTVRCEVTSGDFGRILELGSLETPDQLFFAGSYLEVKVPMAPLGLTPNSVVSVDLSEY